MDWVNRSLPLAWRRFVSVLTISGGINVVFQGLTALKDAAITPIYYITGIPEDNGFGRLLEEFWNDLTKAITISITSGSIVAVMSLVDQVAHTVPGGRAFSLQVLNFLADAIIMVIGDSYDDIYDPNEGFA